MEAIVVSVDGDEILLRTTLVKASKIRKHPRQRLPKRDDGKSER